MLMQMTDPIDKLARELLALPSDVRAQLADRLVESLDPKNDATLRALWTAEALRRQAQVSNEGAETIAAEDVVAEARKLLRQ